MPSSTPLRPTLKSFLLTAALLVFATTAHADILGNNVTCNITGGGSFECNKGQATVQSGVEFKIGDDTNSNYISENFSANQLVLTFHSDLDLDFTVVDNSDTTLPFTGYSLISTDIGAFDGDDISLTNGQLAIDLRGINAEDGDRVVIGLVTPSAVPEPSSLVLLGTGELGVIGAARRRFLA